MSNAVIKHTLVSILDGGTRVFEDDGASPGGKEGPVPNVRRSQMQANADKVVLKGPLKGMRIWWAEKPIKPRFPGDPLADIPVMGAKEEKILDANKEARRIEQENEQRRVSPEVARVIREFAEASKRGAPEPPKAGGA